jgi:hypothetical protein
MGSVDLDDLLRDQDGVVSRAQVLACGEGVHDIRRRVRRREWAGVVDGVYVDHTGELTWARKAMAGVLHAASGLDAQARPVGAALSGHAALRHAIGPSWRRGAGGPIEVAVGVHRSVAPVRGYRFVRRARLDERTDSLRTPPRLRLPDALAELVIGAEDVLDVVGLVADAAQSRYVTPQAVLDALADRPRVPGRARKLAVLQDVAAGTSSALELLFVDGVVRAHGLPFPERQRTHVVSDEGGRVEHRDAEWPGLGVVCELDGRLFHDNAGQHDQDLDRDLDDAADGHTAVRLGWGQVSRRACRTARRLDRLLRRHGWTGEMTPCPACPQ